AGTLDTLAVPGIDKTVLFSTSPFSRVLPVPVHLSLQMATSVPDPASFRTEPKTVAALFEGKFKSVFADRPLPEGIPTGVETPRVGKYAKMIAIRSEEHTSELQSRENLVCRLLLEKKKNKSDGYA